MNIFVGKCSKNVTFVILLATECRMLAIEIHGLGIAIEHCSLSIKWQVSAVQIKTKVNFLV